MTTGIMKLLGCHMNSNILTSHVVELTTPLAETDLYCEQYLQTWCLPKEMEHCSTPYTKGMTNPNQPVTITHQ